jgi:hypothetical protein
MLRKIIFISILVLVVSSFKQAVCTSLGGEGTNITIYQNGKETSVKSEDVVQLPRKFFSIRYNCMRYQSEGDKFYSLQLAAFLDKSELDYIRVGLSTTDILCFSPGTGMAPDASNYYESFTFNNEAHHYVYYESKSEKRANLISKHGDNLRLEFPVKAYTTNKGTYTLQDFPISEYYLVLFIDGNLNQKIEEGELTKLTIRLR